MKCPSCNKNIHSRSSMCKFCGVHLIRQSDKMARKMTMNSRIATASGGFLVFLAIPLFIYEAYLFGGVTLAVGATLMVIGKAMN